MNCVKKCLSAACAFSLMAPWTAAQQPRENSSVLDEGGAWHSSLTDPYRGKEVPPINLANSSRLDALIRAGRIYLSLQDAIALAIENSLDIEVARYGPRLAETDLRRAQAGGSIRGVSTTVSQGASSATGRGTRGTDSTGASLAQGGVGGSGGISGSATAGGVPNLDPSLTSTISWGHRTQPQVNSFLVGANNVVSTNKNFNFELSQGFLTGTRVSLGMSNQNQSTRSGRFDFNPYTSAALNLTLTQPLLQGFGLALNSRFIHIAKNNVQVSNLVFRRQLIATVASVVNLYWDLVAFNEDVAVRQQALKLAEKLLSDNRKQVEIGTLAPIEIIRAEAEVAARQQDLTVAETNVLQQETILKDALSRVGVAGPQLADARIVPTDRIRIPDVEAIEPIQNLVASAMQNRPELSETRFQLENSRIGLRASKNALLPRLDGFVQLQNNALAGQVNMIPIPSQTGGAPIIRDPDAIDPFFRGGFGTAVGQLFRRNFPDYSFGVQMTIPLRNRSAQADAIANQLTLRQNELRQQQQVNAIRVEVQNALIGIQQARARYQTAVKNRVLQEQTLDAEQKKYALGASTIFQIIQSQRDLALAKANEVAAMSQYARSRVEMDRATGRTLEVNNVVVEDAVRGEVSTPPSPIPVIDPQQNK